MDISRNLVGTSTGPAGAFAALGDPARLSILRALSEGTTCVCELTPRLGMPQNLLSYHLRILREAGLVVGERSGRRIEYSMVPEAFVGIQDALSELASVEAGATR